jgi:hypothetical protein
MWLPVPVSVIISDEEQDIIGTKKREGRKRRRMKRWREGERERAKEVVCVRG